VTDGVVYTQQFNDLPCFFSNYVVYRVIFFLFFYFIIIIVRVCYLCHVLWLYLWTCDKSEHCSRRWLVDQLHRQMDPSGVHIQLY